MSGPCPRLTSALTGTGRRGHGPLFSCPDTDRLPRDVVIFFETVPVDPRPTPELLAQAGAVHHPRVKAPYVTPNKDRVTSVGLATGSVRPCYLRPVLLPPAGEGASPLRPPRVHSPGRTRQGIGPALALKALHGLARPRFDPTPLTPCRRVYEHDRGQDSTALPSHHTAQLSVTPSPARLTASHTRHRCRPYFPIVSDHPVTLNPSTICPNKVYLSFTILGNRHPSVYLSS